MSEIDTRKLSPEILEHLRRQALMLHEQGYTLKHIGDVCGGHAVNAPKLSARALVNASLPAYNLRCKPLINQHYELEPSTLACCFPSSAPHSTILS